MTRVWNALMRFDLALVGICQHAHLRRETIDRRLYLVCDECGRSWPAIRRTANEARAVQSGDEAGARHARPKPPPKPRPARPRDNVTPIRRVGRG